MTVVVVLACAAAGIVVGAVLARLAGGAPWFVVTATVVLFVAFAVRLGADPVLPAYCVLADGLVVLSVIDARTHRLPREITYTTLAIGVPLLAVASRWPRSSASPPTNGGAGPINSG